MWLLQVYDPVHVGPIRRFLEESQMFLAKGRVQKRTVQDPEGATRTAILIPITDSGMAELERLPSDSFGSEILSLRDAGVVEFVAIDESEEASIVKKLQSRPLDVIITFAREYLTAKGLDVETYEKEFPEHAQTMGKDTVVIGPASTTFESEDVWTPAFFKDLCTNALRCQRLFRHARIDQSLWRQSQFVLLHGPDGWVEHIENGIRYRWDGTKCMFSRGNASERIRVGKFKCQGQTVVDLYTGIGYFTVPMLVHGGASHLHACEWNPNAIEALRGNLKRNKVSEDRFTIHHGDNRTPELRSQIAGVADRVHLGLIPSSEEGWLTACAALSPHGGLMHVHEVVGDDDRVPSGWASTKLVPSLKTLLAETHEGQRFDVEILHVETVKSYAPHLWHVVVDLKCTPTPL